MQQEKFMQELRENFRLNIYEAKIWTAILSRGIASAGELADISGVPRSRCYDVLESLEKKGFIIMKIGKPIKYLAVEPDIIIDRVKKNIEDEAKGAASSISSIMDTEDFKELELLHKSGIQHFDIDTISKSVIGRTAINKTIKELASGAKTYVTVVASAEHAERMAKLIRNFAPGFAKKGVKLRFFAPYSKNVARKLGNADYSEYNPTTSFVNVDGKQMVFMVSNDAVAPDYEVGIWINSPFFVSAVNVLFEQSLKK